MCSADGLTNPQTMKLKGWLYDEDIVVLIDSGASHNFISNKLAEKLGLRTNRDTPSYVRHGDGNRKQTYDSCNDVQIRLGEYIMIGKFFLFDLGGVDIILEVDWLMTRGS